MDFNLLFEILEYQQKRFPNEKALSGNRGGSWRHFSTDQLIDLRDRLSSGLLRMGLPQGQRVGTLASSSTPEWVIVSAALSQCGLVAVPIHASSRNDEIQHIIDDAGLEIFFISDEKMLDRIRPYHIPRVYAIDPIPGAIHWESLLTETDPEALLARRSAIDPDTLALLLYTSGTTGLPKGVMLSHRNLVSNIKSVLAIVPIGPGTEVLSFLPLSHIFEHMVLYVYQAAGSAIWLVDQIDHLQIALQEVRPHFFTTVPRILERFYERIIEHRNKRGRLTRRVINWALALGERYPYAGKKIIPPDYRLKLLIADLLVYRHWRKALGGRLEGIVVGAAALPPRLGKLLCAARIQIREGYGLTETSPVVAFNRFDPGGVRFGTVGIPIPGVEVRIANPDEQGQGEVEVKGPNVMTGYWKQPDPYLGRRTADGWFKTGDRGQVVNKRFLKITGRVSELFKTSSGKFVAPAYVEAQLRHSPFIRQCMALGLNQPHVGALVVPNFELLERWCQDNRIHWTAPEFMILNHHVEKLFRSEIEHINRELLSPVEHVKAFCLLPALWTPENGLLTATLKLRRAEIEKAFPKEIAGLFEA